MNMKYPPPFLCLSLNLTRLISTVFASSFSQSIPMRFFALESRFLDMTSFGLKVSNLEFFLGFYPRLLFWDLIFRFEVQLMEIYKAGTSDDCK